MLETIFYSLGIIAIVVFLLVVMVIVTIILRIRSEILAFKRSAIAQTVTMISDRKGEIASTVGISVAKFILDKIKKRRSA